MVERDLCSQSVPVGLNVGGNQNSFCVYDQGLEVGELTRGIYRLRFFFAQDSPRSSRFLKGMMTATQIDPLYTIFEQHLFNFQDPNSDRKSFIEAIVKDYLSQVRRMGLTVPGEWEEQIFEELYFQVNTMLVKKIYGCLTINEFQQKLSPVQKKKARTRYQSLQSVKKSA